MTDVLPTIDYQPEGFDRIVEDYLRGENGAKPPHERTVLPNPGLANEFDAFVKNDEWMRRLAGSRRPPPAAGRASLLRSLVETRVGESAAGGSTIPPTVFGEYELLAEIGQGGMGVVYKARQTSVNRIVALKMVRSARLASGPDVERFYTEAESAASLEHPGIVPVYSAGQQDGQHFYSMGFVDGTSLQDLLANESAIPAQEAAELIRRVAEAIHYAHRRGVMHRDLKPGNILLAMSDDQDALHISARRALRVIPKVADFGLAKRIENDSNLTGSGQILGTPSYMPPEQASGESSALSDVYSLGAVLYCLLVGRPPFRGENAIQTLQQVTHDEPVPPGRINSAVPRDLETICLKCLEKLPSRRYGSAHELAADLKRFRDGEPIKARPVSSLEHAVKWVRRHPTRAGLVIAGIALLLTSVGLILNQQFKRELQRSLYVRLVHAAHVAWRENDIAACHYLLDDCPIHLRGWEWHYLIQQSQTGPVKKLEPISSADPKTQKTDAGFGPVFVWDLISGQEVAVIKSSESQPVFGVKLSSDGKLLEIAYPDGTVHTWSLETRQRATTSTPNPTGFTKVTFSSDGRLLACQFRPKFFGMENRHGRTETAQAEYDFINIRTGDNTLSKQIQEAHPDEVQVVELSPDRKRAVSASLGRSAKLWDVTNRRFRFDLVGVRGMPLYAAFSPNGDRVACVGESQSLIIWDSLTGSAIVDFNRSGLHPKSIVGVAFGPDGRQIATVDVFDSFVQIWNSGGGNESTTFREHFGPVRSLAFHPASDFLATAGEDGMLKVWSTITNQLVREFRAHEKPVAQIAFSRDGSMLATTSYDRTVKLCSTSTWNVIRVLDGHKGNVNGLSFSPDARQLSSVSHDGTCIIWNLESNEIQQTYKSQTGPLNATDFDPTGRFVVLAGDVLTIWNHRANSTTDWFWNDEQIVSVSFSPDGRRLAAAFTDRTIRVIETRSGREVALLKGHSAAVSCVVFSPNGDRIASTSFDGSIKIWDPDSQLETLSLRGDGGRANAVAFSPDGRFVASANHDGTVTLWGRHGPKERADTSQ